MTVSLQVVPFDSSRRESTAQREARERVERAMRAAARWCQRRRKEWV